jgi:ketosteroid isomerase-like protein
MSGPTLRRAGSRYSAAGVRRHVVDNRSAVNVELVRRSYRMLEDLREAPDGPSHRLLGELVDEGFELHLPATYPEGAQVFRGREGLRRWILKTREVWDEWRFEIERCLEAGDRVVALVHVVASGGLSGVPLERDTAHVWTIADGKVTRCEVFLDRSEALEGLGLQV